jgi:hypothetical protein
MVKIYPEALPNRIRNDPKRSAEVQLYDALTQQLRGNWSIFYSVAWLGRTWEGGIPQDGESDFIIAHPSHGILLIEVKGGRISYNGSQRQWITTDRDGNNHNIDPFNQVVRSKHALLGKIHSLPRWSNQWITMGHSVAFPHGVAAHTTLPPEASAEIIIDANDMSHLAERIPAIFVYWYGQENRPLQSGAALIADLEKLLAPTITLPNPLSNEVRDEEREILRLTEEQFRLLDFLSRIRRAAISGCAGSGKTTLAVEKAKRLANEGFRTLLTCYNSTLATYLTGVIRDREQLSICTFHQLCSRLTREANIELPSPDVPEQRKVFDEEYPEALIQAIELRPDLKYDAIIVDEGQDFHDYWWLALEECLRQGHQSILYVFYDDNQRVYRNRGSIPAELQHFPLTENVRNTRSIHRTLVTYYQGESPSSPRGPVGRSVEIQHYETTLELRKHLQFIVRKLVDTERLACSDIVILTPRSLSRSVLRELKMEGNYKLVEQFTENQHEVLYSTIHRFKGLERPVVIVVELDEALLTENEQEERDALCYVAFSRPRNHLILLGKQSVIQALLPTDQ